MNKPTLTVIAAAAIATFIFVGHTQAESTSLNESFSVTAGGTLYIDSDAGTIDIESHDQNTVEIEVLKRGKNADDFEVAFEQNGNDVKVEGDKNSNWGGWGNHSMSVKFVVKVPESYNLDLNTGGGSIDVEDVKGNVKAYTSGGSIELGEIEGDVDVKTSGGSIRVEDVAGNIDARTSGGSVKAKLSKQITDDARLSTSGGSVVAYLAPSMAVEIDASTSGGRVKSEFEVDGTVKKNRVRGSINGGGPELTLRTSGGSVSIKEL